LAQNCSEFSAPTKTIAKDRLNLKREEKGIEEEKGIGGQSERRKEKLEASIPQPLSSCGLKDDFGTRMLIDLLHLSRK